MVMKACYTLDYPSIMVKQNFLGVIFSNTIGKREGFNLQTWLKAVAAEILKFSRNPG